MMIPSPKLTSNKDFDRLLPQNLEAEESILGGIMLDTDAIYRVSFVPVRAFNSEPHRIIYKACLELHRSGMKTDLMTVATYLSENKSLEQAGGQSKLVQLMDRTVSAVNIDQYANLILVKYLLREVISSANQIRDLGFSAFPRTAEEIVQEARALLEDAFAAASVLPPAIEKFRLKNKNTLDLEEYLPPKYAKPLKQLAKYYPCPEEICLHSLWAPIASIINPNTNILVRELNGRPEFPIVRTMLIAESSNRKSDVERTFLEPLQKIQEEWDVRYQQELADYNLALTEWEALPIEDKKKRRGEEPIPPTHRFFIYTEGTKEGVQDILSRQPGHAILWAPDEILAAKTSQGEYKGGRGSDQESNLSSFNGQVRTTVRKGRVTKIKDCSSLMGGIQPMALPSLIKDIEDYRGEFARYLPLVFDTQPFIVKDDFPINLTPLLKGLYEQIIDFPAQDFIFSSRAKRTYIEWQNSMEIRRYQHPSAGVRAFLGKIQGYCAKIAMELHLIWEASEGQRTPAKEIPADKIEKAIKIVDFYIEQYFKIRQLMGLDSKDPVKDAIFERLKILGTVTRSNLSSASRIFRNMKDSEVLKHFREIADANPGVISLGRSTRGVLRLKLLREDVDELNYGFGYFDRELEVTSVKLSPEMPTTLELGTLSPPSENVKVESDRLNISQSSLTNHGSPVMVGNTDTAHVSGDSLTLDTQIDTQNQISSSDRQKFNALIQPPTYTNGTIAQIGDRAVCRGRKGLIVSLEQRTIGSPKDSTLVWFANVEYASSEVVSCILDLLDPDNDGDSPDDDGGSPAPSPDDDGTDNDGDSNDSEVQSATKPFRVGDSVVDANRNLYQVQNILEGGNLLCSPAHHPDRVVALVPQIHGIVHDMRGCEGIAFMDESNSGETSIEENGPIANDAASSGQQEIPKGTRIRNKITGSTGTILRKRRSCYEIRWDPWIPKRGRELMLAASQIQPLEDFQKSIKPGDFLKALAHPDHDDFYLKKLSNHGKVEKILKRRGKYFAQVFCEREIRMFNLEAVKIL